MTFGGPLLDVSYIWTFSVQYPRYMGGQKEILLGRKEWLKLLMIFTGDSFHLRIS